MIAAPANLAFLNTNLFGVDIGWRLGLLIGHVIGLIIVPLRRHIPESPRWLLTHGRPDAAEEVVQRIESDLARHGVELPPVSDDQAIEIVPRDEPTYRDLARVLLRDHRTRSIRGLVLMISRSFLYNAIFFTYALILKEDYGMGGGAVS